MLIHTCKLITILVVIYFGYFGYPSFDKYSAKKTMIIESKVKFKACYPPAISISAVRPSNNSFSHGWKVDFENKGKNIEVVCNTSKNINETLLCIENKTFKFSESIEQAMIGETDLKDPALWNRDIFHLYYGNTLP